MSADARVFHLYLALAEGLAFDDPRDGALMPADYAAQLARVRPLLGADAPSELMAIAAAVEAVLDDPRGTRTPAGAPRPRFVLAGLLNAARAQRIARMTGALEAEGVLARPEGAAP